MNKKKWITWTVVILILTNLITAYTSTMISFYLPNGKVSMTRADFNDISKFQKLFMVRDKIFKFYDGKIDDNALVDGAIKGMADALKDPYTVYMDKEEYKVFNESTEGEFIGVGLQVGVKNESIVVIAPIENSPAKKAGILSGDIIEKVDGKDVTGKDLNNAVAAMKNGKAGSEVTLTIEREQKGVFDVKIKRDKIESVTVLGEMLTSDIGYIQITMFDLNTAASFNKKLKELQGKNMKGLILDLRENPGGILDECKDVVSNFIPKGKVIVSTIDKYKSKKEYTSTGGTAIGLPLVVLTDGGTASASEIVSGAVRDYKIGTLVGTKTFGKGIVQAVLDRKIDGFGDGTALKVTVSKYYTPNGENIHGTGIKPDIEVVYPEELKGKPYSRSTDPQFNKALELIKDKMTK